MALHQLTEAELDAVTGGWGSVRQRNVNIQAAANVALFSTLNTTATATASSGGDATATASGGQFISQSSTQSNEA